MSTEGSTGRTPDQVEEQLRAAIAEAASNVEAMGEAAPADPSQSAELAASTANVATQWCNVAVGMIAGLERFRLAHDQVKGSGGVTPVGSSAEKQLLARIRDEAENGASPTRIGQLIAESGIFVEA